MGETGCGCGLECTGRFKSHVAVKPHLDAGAKRVVISAPGADDVDTTMVLGANVDVDQSVKWSQLVHVLLMH